MPSPAFSSLELVLPKMENGAFFESEPLSVRPTEQEATHSAEQLDQWQAQLEKVLHPSEAKLKDFKKMANHADANRGMYAYLMMSGLIKSMRDYKVNNYQTLCGTSHLAVNAD